MVIPVAIAARPTATAEHLNKFISFASQSPLCYSWPLFPLSSWILLLLVFLLLSCCCWLVNSLFETDGLWVRISSYIYGCTPLLGNSMVLIYFWCKFLFYFCVSPIGVSSTLILRSSSKLAIIFSRAEFCRAEHVFLWNPQEVSPKTRCLISAYYSAS